MASAFQVSRTTGLNPSGQYKNAILHFKFWNGPQLRPALGTVAFSLGENSGNLTLAGQQHHEAIRLFSALLGPGASELVITHPVCQ